MKSNIVQLMSESTGLIDLEERLKHEGHTFSNYREYVKWLERGWNNLTRKRGTELMRSPPSDTTFPTLNVKANGISYRIHGISHGAPSPLAPGWHLRRRVRRYINETMQSFHNPSKGEDYVYEQCLHDIFFLMRSQELHDHTAGKSTPLALDFGMTLLLLPIGICSFVLTQAMGGFAYLYVKTIRNPTNHEQREAWLCQKALSNERFQSVYAKYCISQQLPEPFNLEMEYLQEKSSLNLFTKSLFLKPHLATPGERSFWTAGALPQYAMRNNLHTLHYLCGMGHQTEIAYFLQHPDYSFAPLEEYRKKRTKSRN